MVRGRKRLLEESPLKQGFGGEGDSFFRRPNGRSVSCWFVPVLFSAGGTKKTHESGIKKWVDRVNGICCQCFGRVLLIEQWRLVCTPRVQPHEAADVL
jgi:hypothetical protein